MSFQAGRRGRGRVNRRLADNVVKQSLGRYGGEGRGRGNQHLVNPWNTGCEPFSRRPPHYEDDPFWSGRDRERELEQGDGHSRYGRGHHDHHQFHQDDHRPFIPNPRGNWGQGRRERAGDRGHRKTQAEPPMVMSGIPHLEHSFVMRKSTTTTTATVTSPHDAHYPSQHNITNISLKGDEHRESQNDGGDPERRWDERQMVEVEGNRWEDNQRGDEMKRWGQRQRPEGMEQWEETQGGDDGGRWGHEQTACEVGMIRPNTVNNNSNRGDEGRGWNNSKGDDEARRWGSCEQNDPESENQSSLHTSEPLQPQGSSNSNTLQTPDLSRPPPSTNQLSAVQCQAPRVTGRSFFSQVPDNQLTTSCREGDNAENQSAGQTQHADQIHPVIMNDVESGEQVKQVEGSNGAGFTSAPSLEQADTVVLEQETERYYDELMGKRAETSQSLSASQVAKITKEYKSSEEIQKLEEEQRKEEEQQASERQTQIETAWSVLHHYWQFVRDNPYDFNGWTYLLNHVETMDNLDAARSAFDGFLPLYPYCFAYWKKLSDMEMKHQDVKRCLGVLLVGTECVPFCVDLWLPLLSTFISYVKDNKLSPDIVRSLYERGLECVGGAWRSSALWDACITYEQERGDLVAVMTLYRRLIATPLKLYNKHWDHFLALVRDHHPRSLLPVMEYQVLRRRACEELGIRYTPTSLIPPKAVQKTPQPEDKLTTLIKEKIVASYIMTHETNEQEVNKRWKFEEKIKRPYFHVKPLDKKQIKNWNEYLDFEIEEGNPIKIVILFERCMVACAMYEDFWIRYAEYLETQVQKVMDRKNNVNVNVDDDGCCGVGEEREKMSVQGNIKEETCVENNEPVLTVLEQGSEESRVSELGNIEVNDVSRQEIKGDEYSVSENVTASVKVERGGGGGNSCAVQSVGVSREVNNIVDDGVVVSESAVVPRSGADDDDDNDDDNMVIKDTSGGGRSENMDSDANFIVVSNSQTNMNTEQPQQEPPPPEAPDSDNTACNITEISSSEQSDKQIIEQIDEQLHIDTVTPEGNDTEEIECVDFQGGRLESVSCRGDENTETVVLDNSSDAKMTETAVNPPVCTETANATENEPSQVESMTVTLDQLWYDLCVSLGLNERVLKCPPLTPEWIENGVSWEDVRHIYRRGVWIHCPNKPTLLMKWAEFEETQGNLDTARELLNTVTAKHPTLLKARMQMIELERRAGNQSRVEQLYGEASRAITSTRERSWLAIRFARFLFKILLEPDRALVVLRKALKKDRGNIHLYHHVFDICYQSQPVDTQGVLASVLLALTSKELSAQHKYWFSYKRVQFLKEHGDILELKQAQQELVELKRKADQEAREAKKEEEKKQEEEAKKGTASESTTEKETKDKTGDESEMGVVKEGSPSDVSTTTITTTSTNATTTTTTTDPSATQFPVPYFSADGGIAYSPMAGYGYGHSEPGQPLPTAQEVVAGTDGGISREIYHHHQHNIAQNTTWPYQHKDYDFGYGGKRQEEEWNSRKDHYEEYNRLLEAGYPPHLKDKQTEEIKLPFKISVDHLRRRPGEHGLPHNLPDLSQPPPPMLGGDTNPSSTTSTTTATTSFSHFPPLSFSRPPPFSNLGTPGLLPLPMDPLRPPGERPPHHLEHRLSPFTTNLDYTKRRLPGEFVSNRDEPPYKCQRPDDFDQSRQYRPEYNTNYTSSPGASAPLSHRATLEYDNLDPDSHPPVPAPSCPEGYMERQVVERGEARDSPELLRFREVDRYSIRDANKLDHPLSKELELSEDTELCVNVPEWLMVEGGELRLSHSEAGASIIRYWPHFMTDKGEKTVFRILRKGLKWHQRRAVGEGGQWQNLPHLLSWVGPCSYSYSGLTLEKNSNWLPEIVDLLHRLIQYTGNQYNSCFLTLFRNGYDHVPWAQETHPALRHNPSIAAVSLGTMRVFEMQRKNGRGFLRFPLYPGSLLLMEGATQEDWEHQFPKEPNNPEERIHMTFRKLYMIKGLTV